jgi:mono/diheme cytochrome c family protein
MYMRRLLPVLFLTAPISLAPLSAQDGGQLYTLYCSACHGADGNGATGGQFPPLAESAWVQGNAERSIKIVLHGLHGPVEVKGKTYNLEMPPQGAALPDDQIAAILTYVRASWSNKSTAVSADQVKATRTATAARKEHWTAEELLKLHPLENAKPPVENLISYYYKGSFQSMPDFSQLKPDAVEEEPMGLVDYSSYAKTDGFAMMWEGEIYTPDGKHEFYLDSDDGSRLFIDGQLICEIKAIGPAGRLVKKTIPLKKGMHKFRVEYFEFAGNEALSVGMKQQGSNGIKWFSKEKGSAQSKTWPEIMLAPAADRAVMYRNFIQGTSARGIGFGFPGEINMAYSADHFAPELLWPGNFIDAGRHWTDRGVGYEPPAGDGVTRISNKLAYAFTEEAASAWPSSTAAAPNFRGYKLDAKGNPTFSVQIGNQRFLDSYTVPSASSPTLVRTIKASGESGKPVSLLLLSEHDLQEQTPQSFKAGKVKVEVEGEALRYAAGHAILDLKNNAITIRYTWQ